MQCYPTLDHLGLELFALLRSGRLVSPSKQRFSRKASSLIARIHSLREAVGRRTSAGAASGRRAGAARSQGQFFARHAPARKETVKPGDGEDQAPFSQRRLQLCKRKFVLRFPNGQDVRRPLFNPMRPDIATLGLASKDARNTPLCASADRRRRSNAKTGCR